MNSECLNSNQLKAEAQRLGFHCCGLAPAEPVLPEVQTRYLKWLQQGQHADMHYLENYSDKRFDPRLLVPGIRTIVSLAMSYNPGTLPTQKGIALYAQGRDYHEVVKERLQQLMAALGLHGRCFVDTAPVLEKYWAWRCGIGFIGRHTQLVVPHMGSAFFLGELFVEEEASDYDSPMTPSPFENLCGRCRRCQEACPSGAIPDTPLWGIDGSRCLSYLTIENRGELPAEAIPHLKDCFYGCDCCLKACPHFNATESSPVTDFRASEQLLAMTPEDWKALTVEEYRLLFKGSAVKRAKFEGLMRNIQASKD